MKKVEDFYTVKTSPPELDHAKWLVQITTVVDLGSYSLSVRTDIDKAFYDTIEDLEEVLLASSHVEELLKNAVERIVSRIESSGEDVE